ncbi:hypothetical protein HNR25_003733 [Streptomonospora salina]|uniref:Uncharacterized protein n=1 Tax=Streptomonospora salina TaxID=104205 RepID=A0A841EAF6_9ACTN|nr:hypothetical protein [Streptomonospora salina]
MVDQRVPGGGCVAEVDRDLGVLDTPGGAGVLALDADGFGAFLQVAGLVQDQDRVVVAQVGAGVGAQVGDQSGLVHVGAGE